MMKNKGEFQITYLITGIIALLVLAIIFYFIYSFFIGGPILFANLLPEFGSTKKGVEGIEIFRYNIQKDIMEYYNGQKGVSFKKLSLGEKTFSYEEIHAAFRNYYHFPTNPSRKEENVELKDVLKGYSPAVISSLTHSEEDDVPLGSVLIFFPRDNFKREVILTPDDFIYERIQRSSVTNLFRDKVWTKPELIALVSGDYAILRERAMTWRDDILKKPILLSYRQGKDNTPITITACADKVQIYLRVDLKEQKKDCGVENE